MDRLPPSQSVHSSDKYLLSVYQVPERERESQGNKNRPDSHLRKLLSGMNLLPLHVSQPMEETLSQNLGHYTAGSGVLGQVADPE